MTDAPEIQAEYDKFVAANGKNTSQPSWSEERGQGHPRSAQEGQRSSGTSPENNPGQALAPGRRPRLGQPQQPSREFTEALIQARKGQDDHPHAGQEHGWLASFASTTSARHSCPSSKGSNRRLRSSTANENRKVQGRPAHQARSVIPPRRLANAASAAFFHALHRTAQQDQADQHRCGVWPAPNSQRPRPPGPAAPRDELGTASGDASGQHPYNPPPHHTQPGQRWHMVFRQKELAWSAPASSAKGIEIHRQWATGQSECNTPPETKYRHQRHRQPQPVPPPAVAHRQQHGCHAMEHPGNR